MTENNVDYKKLETRGGKAVKLGKGKTFDPAEEFSKLSDSEKSEFTNSMIEVIEKKRRQGQKGVKKIKEVCPKCGEYLKTAWILENRKWKRVGLSCPSSTCDYIIKDLVELEDTEDKPEDKLNKLQAEFMKTHEQLNRLAEQINTLEEALKMSKYGGPYEEEA